MSKGSKALVLAVFLLILSGCANKPLKTSKDSYIIKIIFHDSLESVKALCGVDANGCYKRYTYTYVIHTTRSRCVLDHEIDHVLFGGFHGSEKATCDVRY